VIIEWKCDAVVNRFPGGIVKVLMTTDKLSQPEAAFFKHPARARGVGARRGLRNDTTKEGITDAPDMHMADLLRILSSGVWRCDGLGLWPVPHSPDYAGAGQAVWASVMSERRPAGFGCFSVVVVALLVAALAIIPASMI